jgi:hypothetical protein
MKYEDKLITWYHPDSKCDSETCEVIKTKDKFTIDLQYDDGSQIFKGKLHGKGHYRLTNQAGDVMELHRMDKSKEYVGSLREKGYPLLILVRLELD